MPEKEEFLQRSVFDWVPSKTADGGRALQHELVTANEIANEYGAPRYLVIEYLQHEIQQAASCKSLPFTILLVVSYACVAIAHMDAPRVRAVEHSVSFDIEDNANFAYDSDNMGHKAIYDVNSHVDFWSFMSQGLVPLLFNQERGWSEDLAARNESEEPGIAPFEALKLSDWGMMMIFNRIVGGIRLRQERAEPVECKTSAVLNHFYGRKCLGGKPQYDLDPEIEKARKTIADKNYTRWLYVHKPAEMIEEQVFDLEVEGWLDDYTTKIEIAVPIYNAEYSVHSFITVNFYFQRGGHIYKHIITQSCYATWFTRWYHYAADLIYMSCIGWMFVNEIMDIGKTFRDLGLTGLRHEYMKAWNAIDWLSIICGTVLMMMFYRAIQNSNKVNKAAEKFGAVKRPIPFDVDQIDAVEGYMEELEVAVNYVTFLQRWLARYPLIVVFRLFKAFHAQPRLALVSKTIQSSSVDLCHYLLVCFCVAVGFVTSGVMLFGREVEELATIARGFMFCFRLLLGDMDFDSMRDSSYVLAALWLGVFCVFVVLLLMNMLLAIVMDTYSEVKQTSTSAVTLWDQILTSLHHVRGHHVPMQVVAKYLEANTLALCRKAKDDDDDLSVFAIRRSTVYKRELMDMLRKPLEEDRSWRTQKKGPGMKLLGALFSSPGKILWGKNRKKEYHMTDEQAHEIILGAIYNYYWDNVRSAEPLEFIKLGTRIDERIHKINHAQQHHDLDEADHGDASSAHHLNVKEVMADLRLEFNLFLEDVEADRARAVSEWSRLGAEVDALREKLAALGQPTVGSGAAGLVTAVPPSTVPAAAGPRSSVTREQRPRPGARGSESRLARLEEEPIGIEEGVDAGVDESHVTAPATTSVSPGLSMVRAPEPLSLPNGTANGTSNGTADPLRPDGPLAGGSSYVDILQKQGLLPQNWVPSEMSGLTPEWPEEVSMPSISGSGTGSKDPSLGRGRPRGAGSSEAGSSRGGRRKDWGGMSGMSDFSDPSFADDDIDDFLLDDEDRVSEADSRRSLNSREPKSSGPRIQASRVGGGVGLGRQQMQASSDPMSANALPMAALAGPQEKEFTNFKDAQSQLRHMLSKHRPAG